MLVASNFQMFRSMMKNQVSAKLNRNSTFYSISFAAGQNRNHNITSPFLNMNLHSCGLTRQYPAQLLQCCDVGVWVDAANKNQRRRNKLEAKQVIFITFHVTNEHSRIIFNPTNFLTNKLLSPHPQNPNHLPTFTTKTPQNPPPLLQGSQAFHQLLDVQGGPGADEQLRDLHAAVVCCEVQRCRASEVQAASLWHSGEVERR